MIEALNRETLKRLYITEKKSTPEIAKIFGYSHRTIQIRCREYGIKLRPASRRIIGLNKSVLQRLCVKEGKTSKEVAEMFSCSYPTVFRKCKEYGISLKGRKIKGLTKALLQRLYVKEGKTVCEIAEILDCSRETVRNKCKQFGIKLRPPGVKRKHD